MSRDTRFGYYDYYWPDDVEQWLRMPYEALFVKEDTDQLSSGTAAYELWWGEVTEDSMRNLIAGGSKVEMEKLMLLLIAEKAKQDE